MKKRWRAVDDELGKVIISSHYDVYLKNNNPCSRTVCGHYELDDAARFLAEQINWGHLEGYFEDGPSQPWTLFKAGEGR
jgi:hypothetical protein